MEQFRTAIGRRREGVTGVARVATLVAALLLLLCVACGAAPREALAIGDAVTVRSVTSPSNEDGFDAGTHYFDVMDGTGTTVAVGYCMNLGRVNPETLSYDAGWEYATGALAYIAYHGFPGTSVIAGHQLSELGARTATALAVYMQQGYIEPGMECYVPVGAWEGGGGYSFADRGPTSAEVRQAALDLYLEAQAHAGEDGPWNHAVRVYHAPRGDVQNMLVIERSASATLVKHDAESGEALAGAEFDVVARGDVVAPDGTVQAADGQVVAHVSTGADGAARVGGLPLGSGTATYAFVETKTPDGYVLDGTPHEFTVSTGGEQTSVVTVTVEATNEKNSLVVTKSELGSEDATLPGTEFAWWNAAEGDDPAAAASARTLVVGDDGTLRIEGLAPGDWHLMETRPVPGHLLDQTVRTVHVDEAGLVSGDWLAGGAHASARLENDYTKVDVSKRSATGEDEVPGATLTVRDGEGNLVETWVSGTEPHRIERLEPGTYTLTEEMTPRNYDQAETVTFTVEGTGEVQTVVMRDDPIEVSGQIDKRQEIADPVAARTEANGDGANRAALTVSDDGSYEYGIDFRSTSATWADELTMTDRIDAAARGLAELTSIVTPRASGDYDGLMNVWYQTNLTDPAHVDESGANATRSDGHENPWLEDEGRQLGYEGWRLWRADVPADEAVELSVSELGLDEGEVVTGIRLEYGRVEAGFTTRTGNWDRNGLKDAHDDVDDLAASHDDGLSPAVLRMRATESYVEGTSLDNAAHVDLYRNGGGEGLEAHDEDAVTQTAATAPESPEGLPGTGEDALPALLVVLLGASCVAVPLLRWRLHLR